MIRSVHGLFQSHKGLHAFRRGIKTVVKSPKAQPSKPRSQGLIKQVPQLKEQSQYAFPEKVLIFSSSPGKTALVGWIKLTTIFSFGSAAVYFSPKLVINPDVENWRIIPLTLMSAIPMILVTYITSPYVSSIHVTVPFRARMSRDLLLHFLNPTRLPAETPISLATVRFLPWRSKITSTTVGDLRLVKPGLFKYANIMRVDERGAEVVRNMTLWQKIKYLRTEPQHKFFAPLTSSATKRSRLPEGWGLVMKRIEQHSTL